MSGIVSQNIGRTSGLIKAVEGGGGTWTAIKTLTSDGSDSDLTFVNGASDVVLDSTYPLYCFQLINIHPETNNVRLMMNGSDDTSSHAYDITKISTYFRAYHLEDDSGQAVAYDSDRDSDQATGVQELSMHTSNDADANINGHMYLFGPSSTTFITHFAARITSSEVSPSSTDSMIAGYFNTTAAITAIQFTFTAGEIQGGKIKLFGIKDS